MSAERHALSRSTFLRGSAAVASIAALAPTTAQAAPAVGRTGRDDSSPLLVRGTRTFPGNDGEPHEIGFDDRSFLVDGKRLPIFSGEIHHWRVPAPAQWRMLLQTMRAAGFNAVSFYFFWGLHQSEEGGGFDFTGIKDLDLLLRMAAEEGLYVIARPGPYVNAEISMGGLPAYLTNRSAGLRTTDPQNLADSTAWLTAVNRIITKHQVSDGGGSVLLYQVENELIAEDAERSAFLRTLADHVRSTGVTVPMFHNDYGLGGRFADTAKHHLDFYAYDHYPLGFNAGGARQRIGEAEDTFRSFAPGSPHFITESQGGAFTPWGASFGTDQAYEFTDPAFTRQWGVRNLGNGVTAFNYYMAFGGTNLGYTGSPSSGFTSYDYGAGITEDRLVTEKLAVQKELGALQDAVPAIAAMRPVAAPAVRELDGAAVTGYQRRASGDDGDARLLAFRLADSNDTTDTSFTTAIILGDDDHDTGSAPDADDRDESLSYDGDWEEVADPSAFGGTLMRTTAADANVRWTFTGTAVDVITATGTDHGRARVLVDGTEHETFSSHVDTEQNKPTRFVAYQVTDLTDGEHTITVEALGKPADGGTGTVVTLDAFDLPGTTGDDAPIEVPEGVTGWPRIPQQPGTALHLHGRDAITLVANTVIGDHRLLYCTSQPFGPALPRRGGTLQHLVGHRGDPGELVLAFTKEPTVDALHGVEHHWDAGTGQLRLNYTHTADPQQVRISGVDDLTLRILDREAARTTWILGGDRDAHVVIEGAETARVVRFDGPTAHIACGSSGFARLRLDVPDGVTTVVVNGAERRAHRGIAAVPLPAPRPITIPELSLVTADGAPEADPDHDDADWTRADDTTGSTPLQGPGRGGVVLDSNHYGCFEGSVWYRARFIANDGHTVLLRGNGGTGQPPHGKAPAFGQAWLNGHYLGAAPADGTDQELELPTGAVAAGEEAVLSVVVHNLGQNLDWSDDGLSKQNRGLFDAVLPTDGEVEWRIQGAAEPDPLRTLYNVGGLHGEREGRHLPGFDDSDWRRTDTLVADAPGIRWYRGRFDLDVPTGQDVALRIVVDSPPFEDGRRDASQLALFVNGWNVGLYIGDIGPQNEFTIPTGLLDLHGENTLAAWVAAKEAGAGPRSLRLRLVANTTGGAPHVDPVR